MALVLALGAGRSAPLMVAHAHPALLQLAATQPDQAVSVIIQKDGAGSPGEVEQMVRALGGTVTADLWIINGLGATVPARAVPTLAYVSGVHWISPDGGMQSSGGPNDRVDTSKLANAYVKAIGADQLWNSNADLQGQGIGVAIIDSGVASNSDFAATAAGGSSRLVAQVSFNTSDGNSGDNYGHGTHVAGIIGGNGANSGGTHIGIAPKVNLISLKVADGNGEGTTVGVLMAGQWLLANKARYNIRVANLSLNSAVSQSYNVDPIDMAVEVLWMNGVVVTVSAGNNGTSGKGILYAPANDPIVISVGAMDDKSTASTSDDTLASYSSYGTVENGIQRPDLVAPGSNIISVLASTGEELDQKHHDHEVAGAKYFRMSGTSMSSPMVAGAAVLLIQKNPSLTPNQVKACLMDTAKKLNTAGTGAGYLNIQAAVSATCTRSANQGVPISSTLYNILGQVLAQTGNTTTWSSVNWGSVNWGSVNWGSVNWGSVNWGNTYWGD